MTQIIDAQASLRSAAPAGAVTSVVEMLDPLIGMKMVAKLTTLSPRQIKRMCSEHAFVMPIKISKCRYAWRLSKINNWINERERETAPSIAA